jgi:queuine tRNA-ribosyltransferase
MNGLPTCHGDLALPAFLPDATRAVVRTLDAGDLVACGVDALVVNTLHLSNHPGASVIARVGGVHRFMGWEGPIVSDSGGFQVLSLARESADLVSVTKRGLMYRRHKRDDKHIWTPEKCIQQQFQLGADVLFCLDHCTHPTETDVRQQQSVANTVEWARRCKEEFDRRVAKSTGGQRPLLFGVVQGGPRWELRAECAQRLLEIGFDGYGYGGWPIEEGQLVDMVEHTARLLPAGVPLHALGVGKPENVVRAFRAGYHLFDCVLPTRDARHGRLYVFNEGWPQTCSEQANFYHFLYVKDEKHCADARPIDETCDCLTCRRYSRAYLNHLMRIEDGTAPRLATIHNLRFYMRLMNHLRESPATVKAGQS